MFKMDLLFKSENQIIQEIHNSFDNAQEELLAQAYKIISSKGIAEEKGSRLVKLGFVNSTTAKTYKEREKLYLTSTKDVQGVEYYKQKYPFTKFLKVSQLDEICEKYGLIHAPVENYIKDVPEKNVSEIENAQPLDSKDMTPNMLFYQYKDSDKHVFNLNPEEIEMIKSGIEINIKDPNFIPNNTVNQRALLSNYFDKAVGLRWDFATECSMSLIKRSEGLFIAAPKSHFNLEGLSKVNKFGFMSLITVEVKDPIVFRYVRGGIQVLSKWGLEGDDERLQNEILN